MKLKRMFAFVIAILAVQGTAIDAEAQDWELLGERQVNRQADHDALRIVVALFDLTVRVGPPSASSARETECRCSGSVECHR